MQTVSEAWKQNQRENLVSESYVELSLSVTDPDAQADVSTADNGHMAAWSDAGDIADGQEKAPVRYATLEQNIWVLNGKSKLIPTTPPYGDNGYVGSVLSGNDGTYSVTPTITATFSKVFTGILPGVTITWGEAYGEWAESYRVTAYNGTSVVAQKTFTGNRSVTATAGMDISGYNKITVEVLKWCLPSRRARIKSLMLGTEQTFTKSDIIRYSHASSVDPLSAALPKSEVTFEVANLNGEYNPDNPQGSAKYLMERQMITARYGYRLGGNVEWIKAGTFFMSEWDAPQNGITMKFTARDALEYMGGVYSGPASGTLLSIAAAALNQANLPKLPDGSNRWVLHSSLASISAPAGADLGEASIMEVLQYVANAGCCVFYQDRSGILRIEPLATGVTDYEINRFNSYADSEISLTKQLKAVDVNRGQHVLTVGENGETQQVSNPLISDAQAQKVAQWVAAYLQNRRIPTGNFRADPRLDPLDRVMNTNRFSESVVLVTEIAYTYNGAFKGSYEGRQGV